MAKQQPKGRKGQTKNRAPKTLDDPISFNSLTPGDVVYARIAWGEGWGEWKTRPVIYSHPTSRWQAAVIPIYSKPHTPDSTEIEVNNRRCYAAYPTITIDKLDIVATTKENLAELLPPQ